MGIVQFSKEELNLIVKILAQLKFEVGQSQNLLLTERILKKASILMNPQDPEHGKGQEKKDQVSEKKDDKKK